MLAPVGISVYTRLDHFRKTISALQNNPLSEATNLVIYSDAASSSKDRVAVDKVRNFARNISGFRTVTIIERPYNYGGVKNAHEGVKQLVKIFKWAIFIEDDIETAPGFLSFMNEALVFYRDNPQVVSISGYSPPIGADEIVKDDFFVMDRFCGWGCGVYERTVDWLTTKIMKEEFDAIPDKKVLCEFGDDVLWMVEKEVSGELDAADVRCMYRQALNNVSTIYPKRSLVQNIGHDGSGVHCGKTDRFHHDALWNKKNNFNFSNVLNIDSRIKREKQDFRAQRGKYKPLALVSNKVQCKQLALSYIENLFESDLKNLDVCDQLLDSYKPKVALLSTPRVGSTWLSSLLIPYFGNSIRREWLHCRYLESYQRLNKGATPRDYLDFIRTRAFSNEDNIGLHFHVNQYIYWKKVQGIDLFEFFNFDQIIYMKRRDLFSQVYSFAAASGSGLWGHEIISRLSFHSDFKLKVTEEEMSHALSVIQKELRFYEKELSTLVSHEVDYEFLVNQSDLWVSQFVNELNLKNNNSEVVKPSVNKSLICFENRDEMSRIFSENSFDFKK